MGIVLVSVLFLIRCTQPCTYLDPVTNGDWVRTLSNEGLAEVCGASCPEPALNGDWACPEKDAMTPDCQKCYLRWLTLHKEFDE